MKRILFILTSIFYILFSGCSENSDTGVSLIPSSLDLESLQSSLSDDEPDRGSESQADSSQEHTSVESAHPSASEEPNTVMPPSQQPTQESNPSSSETSKPSEISSAPEPTTPPTSPQSSESSNSNVPPIEKSIYDYPFDIEGIKNDLIRYGVEELKMTHRITEPDGTVRTPDNCAWRACYPLTSNCTNSELTRRQLYEMVKYDKDEFNLKNFTIYIKPDGADRYLVYMLY